MISTEIPPELSSKINITFLLSSLQTIFIVLFSLLESLKLSMAFSKIIITPLIN